MVVGALLLVETFFVIKFLLVRMDMDVNEHERLYNIILGHKLK
jgi:hypothetical protein